MCSGKPSFTGRRPQGDVVLRLADQRGGGHLSAGHAVDRVVDEEDGDLFAAIGRMHDFGGADGGQIAIALVGNHNLVGTGPFQAGRRGGSAPMRDLHVAHIKVVVGENRAAYRTDQDGLILHPQIFQSFGDQFVRDAVAASRAVVRLVLADRFCVRTPDRTARDFECTTS